MLRFIEKTRKKPKEVKNQYAFFGAVGVTFVIAFFWSISLPSHFANFGNDVENYENETSGAFSQFFEEAKNNFATIFQATKEAEKTGEVSIDVDKKEDVSNIIIPELTEDTITEVKDAQNELSNIKPRTVLIGTTSEDEDLISSGE